MNISVKIHFPSGEISRGVLTYTPNGPKLANQESLEIVSDKENIQISVVENYSEGEIVLQQGLKFEYHSKSTIRKYTSISLALSEMYPPSSRGWVTHLSDSGSDAVFSLQQIFGKDQFLLSIVDYHSGQLLRLHLVNAYEVQALMMETDWMRYNRIFNEVSEDYEEVPLEKILESPAPSWSDLGQLLDGVNIPNLKRGSTVRETMEQLVPESFPEKIRLELMAFLAYVINLEIPDEDPMEYRRSTRGRFKSAPLLRLMIHGHIQSLLEGKKPPQYVRIMTMADRGLLETGIEPTHIATDPWTASWHRIMEKFPNNSARVAKVAQDLNQTSSIITRLTVSRQDARKSKSAWNERFSLIRAGLMLRGYVQEHKIGLSKLVFLGRTNRWPHNHLAWSARLGNPEQNPPYLQVLIMPKTSIPKLERLRQKTALVNWSAARVNFRLFNPKQNNWKVNLTQIKNSFSSSFTLSRLNKEYGMTKNKEIIIPDESMVRLLDLSSFGMYLSSIEVGSYDEFLGISGDSIKQTIESLQEKGVLQVQYFAYLSGLVSICLEIKGVPNQLYSITRALLKHLPSAKVLISEEKGVCYVLGRVPEEAAYQILTEFPAMAAIQNIELKAYRVTAYVDYLHNLHQRLLTAEGTWDDDISGLLSQFRS